MLGSMRTRVRPLPADERATGPCSEAGRLALAHRAPWAFTPRSARSLNFDCRYCYRRLGSAAPEDAVRPILIGGANALSGPQRIAYPVTYRSMRPYTDAPGTRRP